MSLKVASTHVLTQELCNLTRRSSGIASRREEEDSSPSPSTFLTDTPPSSSPEMSREGPGYVCATEKRIQSGWVS